MSTELGTNLGVATVHATVTPDSQDGWELELRVSAPTLYVLEPTIERQGDLRIHRFNVSGALVGKTYELVLLEADGEHRTIASGTIVSSDAPLAVEIPADTDEPTITVGDTPPADPEVDDIFVDTSAPTFFVGSTPPPEPRVNDIWFDTSITA